MYHTPRESFFTHILILPGFHVASATSFAGIPILSDPCVVLHRLAKGIFMH